MDDRYQYLALMAPACCSRCPWSSCCARGCAGGRWSWPWRCCRPSSSSWPGNILGIVRDHWSYSPRFTTGIMLGPMPLEELVFFLVIPVCGLLTHEAVGTVLRRGRGREDDAHA